MHKASLKDAARCYSFSFLVVGYYFFFIPRMYSTHTHTHTHRHGWEEKKEGRGGIKGPRR